MELETTETKKHVQENTEFPLHMWGLSGSKLIFQEQSVSLYFTAAHAPLLFHIPLFYLYCVASVCLVFTPRPMPTTCFIPGHRARWVI